MPQTTAQEIKSTKKTQREMRVQPMPRFVNEPSTSIRNQSDSCCKEHQPTCGFVKNNVQNVK